MPALAIAVDGYGQNAENEKQIKIDTIKDQIFEKYGSGMLKFGTDESQEETGIIEIFMKVLNKCQKYRTYEYCIIQK